MNRRSLTGHDVTAWSIFAVISLLIYSQAFDNGFRQDDYVFLRHAETSSLLDSFKPSADVSFYRPGSLLLFSVEHRFFARNPGRYIAFNFALHLIVSILMVAVFRRIVPVPGSEATAAGLFLLGLCHYGKTVMWACCCGQIASVAISLAGMLFALRWAECGEDKDGPGAARRRGLSLLCAIALMTTACLFHEGAIVVPAVALIAVPACSRAEASRIPRGAALLLMPILLLSIVYWALSEAYPVYRFDARFLGRVPDYLVRYAGFAVVPLQKTEIIHAPTMLRGLIGLAPRLHTAAGALLLAVLGFLAIFRKSGLRILGIWSPAAILPFTLIALPEGWLELRYLYFAAIPLCGLAASGFHWLVSSREAASRAVALVLMLLAVLGTSTLVLLLERHYADFPGA